MVEGNVDDVVGLVAHTILTAADFAIPKTSSVYHKHRRPWWNPECTAAKRQQQKAWGIFRRYPTADNLTAFKKAKAVARKVRRRCQRESWNSYISSITPSVSSKTLWTKVKRAMGLYNDPPIKCLNQNGQIISDVKEIANSIGAAFASLSSSSSYTTNFLSIKRQAEKRSLNFHTSNNIPYNSPFTESELITALNQTKNTSPGPDGITYPMLKHLSVSSLNNLLLLYNSIWTKHTFPTSWQQATVIPFSKPGKDPSNPHNYRPIALTSCLCKLLEKMVNARLVYILEEKGSIHPFQSGFRKSRSTLDNILFLENQIRTAFLKRNHLVSVFFDIEKAYDRTWRYGILRDMYDMDIRGNLPIFIKNFLAKRIFNVRIGGVLSDSFRQEEGVPQGSVLSVTLFSIKINNILNQLPPSVLGCLYVDDLQISCRGSDIRFIERQLQIAIRLLLSWTDSNGFTFSNDKTFCVHFCSKRGIHLDPEIYLRSQKISVVESTKFLGVYFDKKLTFAPHITYLRTKCEKSLNLLRVLANTSWGAERSSMLRIYRATIRSRMDYACAIYGSARNSVLKKLDTVHHSALRICSGAFRTSPVQSLYVTCTEPSLHFIREQTSLTLFYRILSHPSHPLHRFILDRRHDSLYSHRPSCIPSFGFRVRNLLDSTHLAGVNVHTHSAFSVPPWYTNCFTFLNPFAGFKKTNTNALIYQRLFAFHRSQFSNYNDLYTDGSKSHNHVGCAVYYRNNVISHKLHNSCSVLTAELLAIKEALNFISHQTPQNFIIYTDSMSALESLKSQNPIHVIACDILEQLESLRGSGHCILLCWVPGHAGIKGNEEADAAAKSANHTLTMPVPFPDIKYAIKTMFRHRWQQEWNGEFENKLHAIRPVVGVWPSLSTRKHDVVLTRLRIGHVRMTHRHLLLAERAPVCPLCQDPLTVKHVLTDCPNLRYTYSIFFDTYHPALEDLLGETPHKNIFNFIKSTGFYYHI